MPTRIFLSYPNENREEVRELAHFLARRKLEPWFDDRAMARAGHIEQEVRRAVGEAACCVLVLSPHTEKSAWCLLEAGAFWGSDKHIIVYRTDQALLPPAFLMSQRTVDSHDEVLEAIHDALRENPTTLRATLERCEVGSMFRIPIQNALRQARVTELVAEEGRRAMPRFRLLASSGYNYLHAQGNVWKAGLGKLVVERGAPFEVVLQSPFSPAAVARATFTVIFRS